LGNNLGNLGNLRNSNLCSTETFHPGSLIDSKIIKDAIAMVHMSTSCILGSTLHMVFEFVQHQLVTAKMLQDIINETTLIPLLLPRAFESLDSETILNAMYIVLQLLERMPSSFKLLLEAYNLWTNIDKLQSHDSRELSDTAHYLYATYFEEEDFEDRGIVDEVHGSP
jgi:hypothetical protein